ncbi:Lrp/AsnC family transcriptional regulator [Cohnella lubricantis]|uniref:Lrp/AsnC family transcriptional regulator n=1 Tax=Cohnella lubricantis TaxID=2163172 RepID=A0A841TH66_9BACL|nr:Lrp/AsnC family transcriptional regulator [Cohnella lubricantis]MBB6677791.1 Lrp/AsnC family transcriptional regulator [Cohnella lubricantis]MBP2118999.1 DNA-binding MarR family transcriptional regulator [Cohnella lubricantis]
MLLTKRRKQFLRQLVDLYRATKLPIHYETLASALGVSKWTAYDMLKAIERMGLLIRSYGPNRGEGGRSQVLFTPTAQAEELCKAEADEPAGNPEEWQATKAAVLKLLGGVRAGGIGEALQRMNADLKRMKRSRDFCAYSIVILLAHLQHAGGRTEEFVRQMVQKAPSGEMRMTMFAGAVLGAVCQTMAEAGAELAELAGHYLKSVAGLTDHEKELMSDLLLEALV